MIITKLIEVGLDIYNCINIYVDPDNIKNILSDRYVGKCYASCWIKSVDEIVKMSECVINQDGAPNFGTLSVIFRVTGVVFVRGEVINGCRVVNKDDQGIIICSTDIASIHVNTNYILESVTKGQIIPLCVYTARYNPSAAKISVTAVPYIFADKATIYKLSISDPIEDFLADTLRGIEYEEAEMTRLKKENPKAWDFFDQILYAYKEMKSPPPNVKLVNMMNLIGGTTDLYISRDPRLNMSSPMVYVYTDTQFADGATVRDNINGADVLVRVLENYRAHLRIIREMIEIYSTEELITRHKNLWQIFRKYKK